jgi:membrane-bound lytic murein transglycosylase MltF
MDESIAGQLRTALAAKPRVQRWSPYIAAAAAEYAETVHIEPLELALILAAIMDRETGGNNIDGDGGHGRGLMQVDDRFHGAWLAAHDQGHDPQSNVAKGCEILCSGLMAAHPLHPDDKLRVAIAAYNCGLPRALKAAAEGDPDKYTTPGPTHHPDYSADVLRRRNEFAAKLVTP